MSGDLGATTWSYDGAGRVTHVDAPAGPISYGYDDAGRRESMTLPTGTIDYDYFDDGRLSAVTDPSGTYGFTYFADGRLQTLSRPNGVITTDGYDAAGRLTSVTHRKGAAVVAAFTYTLDASGNRTSMTTAGATETYTINELNQLTRVDLPGGSSIAYTYDLAGNRRTKTAGGVTTTYGYDDASRLTSAGAATFTYDAEGNRLTGGGSTFTYDELGRLSGVSGGGLSLTYQVDGDGLRSGSTTGGTTRRYLWDRGTPGGQLLSDGVATYLQAGSELLAQATGGSTTYPLGDALGSVRAITDGAGTVVGTAGYDAFGARTSPTGVSSAFGFAGSYTDASGLPYLRARSLDPATGVFLSTDPMRPGAPGVVGYNPYSYVANNPTTWTDPNGMTAITSSVPIYARIAATIAAELALGAATAAAILRFALILALPVGIVCSMACDVALPPWDIPWGPRPGAEPLPGTDKLIDYLTKLRGLTQAAAEEVVKACARFVALGLLGGPDLCTGDRLPIYVSGGQDQPNSTFHIGIAALLMGKSLTLHQGMNPDRAAGLPHKWYDQVRFQPNACSNRGSDWCDEYPFWSTVEGGKTASLMPVPDKEGQKQGGVLGALYNVCLTGKADKAFLVLPVPLAPSTFACVP
jgi:RHS repeat-associated protein